jgi:hypothetical protein
MFKIREIGLVEPSNRQLPLLFPDQAAAIEHIMMLQAHFERRGLNEEHAFWWARDEEKGEVYRWTVE